MKTINVKPIEEIEFNFPSGEKYICSFNMRAMGYMQEAITTLDGRLDEISTNHLVAMMLYAGIKANDENFTQEQANALAMSMDPSCYAEIIESYENAFMGSMSDKDKTQLKKAMIQYLSNVRMSTSE